MHMSTKRAFPLATFRPSDTRRVYEFRKRGLYEIPFLGADKKTKNFFYGKNERKFLSPREIQRPQYAQKRFDKAPSDDTAPTKL